MKKTEKINRKMLAALVSAAVICGASACSSNETKSGGADSSTTAAPASQNESGSIAPDDAPASAASDIDPKTADYSKVDVTIPFGSGSQIVDFTNDMQSGKYDGKIVKCEGITSRRMNGNAMMQVQDDGTKRGFTWYIVDSTDANDYPPEDAQAEITGIVGKGEYDVRYLYVLPENVVIKSGSGSSSEASKISLKTGVWWSTGANGDSYYTFKNDGTGTVLSQDVGIGVGFNYEFGENSCKFEMAEAGNFITTGVTMTNENECVFTWDNGNKETLTYYGTDEGFRFYSNYELIEMARVYFAKTKDLMPGDGEAEINPDKTIKVHFSYIGSDNTPGDYWIDVDRFTAAGTDMNGETVDLKPYEGAQLDNYFVQRSAMRKEDAVLGVRFLGYIQSDANDPAEYETYIHDLLQLTGASTEIYFTDEMIKQNFFTTGDGTELYMIIPVSQDMKIEVSKATLDETTATLKKGDTVYSGDGCPILVKCNVSEIMPDVIITITDTDGNSFEWSPSISGNDGSVVTRNAAGKKIKDFTDYSKLATTDNTPRG